PPTHLYTLSLHDALPISIELSLKPLRSLLESLLAQESLPPERESTPRDQALLAELQRYMPKQLTDKIRASGHIEGERRQVTVVLDRKSTRLNSSHVAISY